MSKSLEFKCCLNQFTSYFVKIFHVFDINNSFRRRREVDVKKGGDKWEDAKKLGPIDLAHVAFEKGSPLPLLG